mmetsp:Transcript_71196/g.230467  ORF Transcript_71196/g.230467 Transcript_71196/m.230467 type:complete len:241 (-) Transcript_71196:645-1367(-)
MLGPVPPQRLHLVVVPPSQSTELLRRCPTVSAVLTKLDGRPCGLHGIFSARLLLSSTEAHTGPCVQVCVRVGLERADANGDGRILLPLMAVVVVPKVPEVLARLPAGLAGERHRTILCIPLAGRPALGVGRGVPRAGVHGLGHRLVDVRVCVGLGLLLVRRVTLRGAVRARTLAPGPEGLHRRNLVVVLRPLGLELVRRRLWLEGIRGEGDAPLLPGPVALARSCGGIQRGVGWVPARWR